MKISGRKGLKEERSRGAGGGVTAGREGGGMGKATGGVRKEAHTGGGGG